MDLAYGRPAAHAEGNGAAGRCRAPRGGLAEVVLRVEIWARGWPGRIRAGRPAPRSAAARRARASSDDDVAQVDQRVRRSQLGDAAGDEMQQRVKAGLGDVGVGGPVESTGRNTGQRRPLGDRQLQVAVPPAKCPPGRRRAQAERSSLTKPEQSARWARCRSFTRSACARQGSSATIRKGCRLVPVSLRGTDIITQDRDPEIHFPLDLRVRNTALGRPLPQIMFGGGRDSPRVTAWPTSL